MCQDPLRKNGFKRLIAPPSADSCSRGQSHCFRNSPCVHGAKSLRRAVPILLFPLVSSVSALSETMLQPFGRRYHGFNVSSYRLKIRRAQCLSDSAAAERRGRGPFCCGLFLYAIAFSLFNLLRTFFLLLSPLCLPRAWSVKDAARPSFSQKKSGGARCWHRWSRKSPRLLPNSAIS